MRSPAKFLLSPEVTVTLLWSPVANNSLFTSDDVSSLLSASRMNDAEKYVGHLVLPEGELYLVPRVIAGGSELKQLGRFVLLLSEHCLLLILRQVWCVAFFPL